MLKSQIRGRVGCKKESDARGFWKAKGICNVSLSLPLVELHESRA